eukprot:COSAG02_NODE_24641_length_681_cov_2.300687_1_plen_24_part_10
MRMIAQPSIASMQDADVEDARRKR